MSSQPMNTVEKVARYGDWSVPVLKRDWVAPSERQLYRKTYCLTAGQSWSEAPTTDRQWEYYALSAEGQAVPVGALIARELVSEGALAAAFTEVWGRCVLVGPDLICLAKEGPVQSLLNQLYRANGNSYGGLPDVIGVLPNDRIALREAKNLLAKDRLRPNQHAFARAVQQSFGDRLDLAIVEWGFRHV